ncbi:hypothetical protein ASJ81_14045 [Methanosarcina spelaei]|uniref:Acyltransferase 3 domain-containing protein n=1 Tax=Methanosarcina spelaei TaxID=1036679 RepID=A0A2A2HYE6_9EURY|nr:acyltransferase [Methanosarcina spelaei]PAV14388.1 hypothetical protein ASJ81_14045 [Methanosarcina spelaei]
MGQRFLQFDILRSIAIVFIVLTHMHLFYNTPLYNSNIFLNVGDWGLVIFFFISGFLLTANNNLESKEKILIFLKKRIKRIYPLYIISILLTYIMFVIFDFKRASLQYDLSIISLIVHLIVIQAFIPQTYLPNHTFLIPALWYVSAIIWYYILYSIIIYKSKNIKEIIFYSGIVMIPFIILKIGFNLIQFRAFYYYPIFILGIISSIISKNSPCKKINSYITILIALIFSKLVLFDLTSDDLINTNIIYFFSLFILISLIESKFSAFQKKSNIISHYFYKISYCSYAVYLFHFPVLCFFKTILDFNHLISQELQSKILLFLGVPLLFIIGNYIQKEYDNRTTSNKQKELSLSKEEKNCLI